MRNNKSTQLQGTDLHTLEKKLNHLWGELNTVNLSNKSRTMLENRLAAVEIDFKKIMQRGEVATTFSEELDSLDLDLALAALEQAEQEISKSAHTQSTFQALENIKRELKEKRLTPSKARHELKEIVRRHHA